jgi:hypothetical protein
MGCRADPASHSRPIKKADEIPSAFFICLFSGLFIEASTVGVYFFTPAFISKLPSPPTLAAGVSPKLRLLVT